jgi:hypothetical protein
MVKIGYSSKPEERVHQFNRYTTTTVPYKLYAKYKTPIKKNPDKLIHYILDSINPGKRKLQNREFFKISPEVAISILNNIATVSGTTKNFDVKFVSAPKAKRKRAQNFKFSDFGIKKGAVLTFKNTNIKCTVKNDREVLYEGKTYAISALASKLIKDIEHKVAKPNGFRCFKYKGKVIKK